MLAVERRNLILDKIQEERKVIVSELSKEFEGFKQYLMQQ